MRVAPNYVMKNILLKEVKEIKDLGVFYDSLLVFDKHICEKINKAYMMLGIIKRNFTYISRKCLIILYKSLVISQVKLPLPTTSESRYCTSLQHCVVREDWD